MPASGAPVKRPTDMKRMECDQNDGYSFPVPQKAQTVRIILSAPVPGGIRMDADGKPKVAGPFAPVPTFADYVVHYFERTKTWAVIHPDLYQRLEVEGLL